MLLSFPLVLWNWFFFLWHSGFLPVKVLRSSTNQSINQSEAFPRLTSLSGAVQQIHKIVPKNKANIWYGDLITILVKKWVVSCLQHLAENITWMCTNHRGSDNGWNVCNLVRRVPSNKWSRWQRRLHHEHRTTVHLQLHQHTAHRILTSLSSTAQCTTAQCTTA